MTTFVNDKGGVDPLSLSLDELRELGHPESFTKAIRAKCLDCVYTPGEVRRCVQTSCPLWPYRMGKNAFTRAKKGMVSSNTNFTIENKSIQTP